MNIALIIVGGLVLMTFFPTLFGYLEKKKKFASTDFGDKVRSLEQKITILEDKLIEKDEQIGKLQTEMSFVNKLIEDKSQHAS
jgi:hypothetical protein